MTSTAFRHDTQTRTQAAIVPPTPDALNIPSAHNHNTLGGGVLNRSSWHTSRENIYPILVYTKILYQHIPYWYTQKYYINPTRAAKKLARENNGT